LPCWNGINNYDESPELTHCLEVAADSSAFVCDINVGEQLKTGVQCSETYDWCAEHMGRNASGSYLVLTGIDASTPTDYNYWTPTQNYFCDYHNESTIRLCSPTSRRRMLWDNEYENVEEGLKIFNQEIESQMKMLNALNQRDVSKYPEDRLNNFKTRISMLVELIDVGKSRVDEYERRRRLRFLNSEKEVSA
jgi:hypothetical protein